MWNCSVPFNLQGNELHTAALRRCMLDLNRRRSVEATNETYSILNCPHPTETRTRYLAQKTSLRSTMRSPTSLHFGHHKIRRYSTPEYIAAALAIKQAILTDPFIIISSKLFQIRSKGVELVLAGI